MNKGIVSMSRCASAFLISHAVIACGSPETSDDASASIASSLDGTARITTGPHELMQSETAQAVGTFNGQKFQVVAYNDTDIPPWVEYPDPTDRVVRGDASQLVWAFKRPSDSDWAFGKIFPESTSTIDVLWGDPAIAAFGSNVYLTYVTARRGIFPGEVHGSMVGHLQGACVVRSVDGGQNFTISDADCPVSANDFYDGSAMQVSPDGSQVFVAYKDHTTSQIHVWRGGPNLAFTDAQGSGGLMPIPFPGSVIISHPRLAWSGDTLMVAAIDQSNRLLLSRLVSGASPRWLEPIVVATDALNQGGVTISGQFIRLGNGFSMAVGPLMVGAAPSLVVWYTKFGGSTRQLAGVACSLPSGPCTTNWQTPVSSNSFNPAVGVTLDSNGAPSWRTSYYTDEWSPGALRIARFGFTFSRRTNGWLTSRMAITNPQVPCSDMRGYWGDYDYMIPDPAPHGTSSPLIRTFTDSTLAPGEVCEREMYRGIPQHVSEALIP